MRREFVLQFNTNNNAKLKNTTTIIKLSQTILVCSYSCDSCVDHVVSLWNGLTSLWTQYINMVQIMRKLIEAEHLATGIFISRLYPKKLP